MNGECEIRDQYIISVVRSSEFILHMLRFARYCRLLLVLRKGRGLSDLMVNKDYFSNLKQVKSKIFGFNFQIPQLQIRTRGLD